jgi:hypothetical protein
MSDLNPTALEKLLAEAGKDGWGFLDSLEKAGLGATDPAAPVAESQDELASRALARLVDSDDGRTVMEWLIAKTLARASWSYQLGMDPMQIAMQGVMREGQNSVVFMMLRAAARGRPQDDPPSREQV